MLHVETKLAVYLGLSVPDENRFHNQFSVLHAVLEKRDTKYGQRNLALPGSNVRM
jgi:hypothetical protein